MLMLKITDADGRAHGGFQWPAEAGGTITCPDWDPAPRCGGGLHGWADGSGSYRHHFNDGVWYVVDCPDGDVVHLDDKSKCKIPGGTVVYRGTREGAVAVLKERRALTRESNPAWACLTPQQAVQVALKAADRAVRIHAPAALRARGMGEQAKRLEELAPITDGVTAEAGRKEARSAAYAAAAAAAAAAADAYAAAAAAYAADAADAADAAAAYAADAAAYAAAAYAAAYADAWNERDRLRAAARADERERVRLDKLDALGL